MLLSDVDDKQMIFTALSQNYITVILTNDFIGVPIKNNNITNVSILDIGDGICDAHFVFLYISIQGV